MAEHTKHPEPTPRPASIFSEAPEVVSAEHQHKGPVSPCSKTYLPAGQSLISTLYSSHTPPTIHGPPEKQYPDQPDSLGQTQAHDALTPISALPEKAYQDQALSPYSQTQAHLQGCPQQFYAPSGHPSGYATVVPLHCVQSAPCPVDCPVCGKREMTSVEFVNGGTTHGWAAILCMCFCLGCIPYLMSSLKDAEHSCGKCGTKLARWHKSGRVNVLQTGARK